MVPVGHTNFRNLLGFVKICPCALTSCRARVFPEVFEDDTNHLMAANDVFGEPACETGVSSLSMTSLGPSFVLFLLN